MSAKTERIKLGIWGLFWTVPTISLAGVGLIYFVLNIFYLFLMLPIDAVVTEVIENNQDSGAEITLNYQYTVDKQKYTGSDSWSKGIAGTSKLARLSTGEIIRVYYYRTTPNKSLLLKGSENLVGVSLFVVPFILIGVNWLRFALTGRRWITTRSGAMGIRIVSPPWCMNFMAVLAFSGFAHIMLSIMLPWRVSVILGLVLVFCIVPVAAWLIIGRSVRASAKVEKKY